MTEESKPWKLGPFVVAPTISLSGLLAIVMAFIAVVGGWYKFDYRVNSLEVEIQELQQQRGEELQINQKLNDTLNQTNAFLGALKQALEDKGIHVTQRVPGTLDEN